MRLPSVERTSISLRAGPVEADRARLAAVLREAVAEGDALRGVLSLLALDESPLPVVPTGLSLTLSLVQALGDLGIEAPLWLLTRGAVSIDPSDPLNAPVQAFAWGLGRVVGFEHSERWGGLLDLPDRLDPPAIERLLLALGNRTDEDQLALRSTGLYARRLVHAPLGETASPRIFKPQGTVLITGGTGALGAHVARWLAGQGAEHLVLTSRRGPDAPGAVTLQEEFTALGARVTLAACDVADRHELGALIERLDAEGSPVRAVIHTAGVSGQLCPLNAITLAELAEAVSGKARGAQHLHDLFGDRHLDAFVLFSSGAGVWGGAHEATSAAANAFLDALAKKRRDLGLPATSVAWGAWAGSGMANDEAVDRLKRRGAMPMAPALAIAALRQSLDHDETAVTVADFDWSRFAARRRPLLDDIPEARCALGENKSPAGTASLAQRLLLLPAAERERTLLDLVRTEAATVLGVATPAALEVNRPFHEFGLASLMAVELRNRLCTATGLRLEVTVTFDYPTPKKLAAFLLAGLEAELSVDHGGTSSRVKDEDGFLIKLVRRAQEVGAFEENWKLLSATTQARAIVEASSAQALAREAPPVRLASGPAAIRLVCFLPFFAPSGPIVYSSFASNLKNKRDIWVIPHSGFLDGQLLSRSLDDFISSHARLASVCAGDAPFALLGHSTGAYVAQAVAEHLERIGRGPSGLVLLDPFERITPSMRHRLMVLNFERPSLFGGHSDAFMTAMWWYYQESGFFTKWKPTRVSSPILHVRASECMPGFEEEEWRSSWFFPATAIDAPGDHSSILQNAEMARAVDEWLSSLTLDVAVQE